jgi:S1-C subfamily serine protease
MKTQFLISRIHVVVVALCASLSVFTTARTSPAAELSSEAIAEKLNAATVTVRLTVNADETLSADKEKITSKEQTSSPNISDKNEKSDSAKSDQAKSETTKEKKVSEVVTVCTGVSVGKGLIVTFFVPPADIQSNAPRVRITLPGGAQADAHTRVIDRYSGLLLLETSNTKLPALELADQAPKVGSSLMTASAAGIEQPAISLGILSTVERSLPGSDLPPVMQCDLRTTETSSGGAVVNRDGKLVGILVASTQPNATSTGWSYALSVRHIERLVKAKANNRILELKRQRPMAGFRLGAGDKEGMVRVERVEVSGPAAKAGVQVNDLVLVCDDVKIRSAYQAVDLILKKQPGDHVQLVVERDGKPQQIDLTLGGGSTPLVMTLPTDDQNKVKIGPEVTAAIRNGKIEVVGRDTTAEVAVDPKKPMQRSPDDEAEMLRTQLSAYERVIVSMQKEVEALRKETTELRKQIAEQKSAK